MLFHSNGDIMDYVYLETIIVIGFLLLIFDCGLGIYLKVKKLLAENNDKSEV